MAADQAGTDIPSSCDCVWSLAEMPDGSVVGSIFIASERCQRTPMHARTFRQETDRGHNERRG